MKHRECRNNSRDEVSAVHVQPRHYTIKEITNLPTILPLSRLYPHTSVDVNDLYLRRLCDRDRVGKYKCRGKVERFITVTWDWSITSPYSLKTCSTVQKVSC